MHYVIIVNGLGGETTPLRWATASWKQYGLTPIVFHIDWKEKNTNLENKLNSFLEKIDSLISSENKVSLIGCSAGAGFVLNAFLERRNAIDHVINICGPVRMDRPQTIKLRSISWWKNVSPLLIQSLTRLEDNFHKLRDSDIEKIMTIRAAFGDELVPSETIMVKGAYNITIPTIEHTLSIYLALTIFKKRLIKFLYTK